MSSRGDTTEPTSVAALQDRFREVMAAVCTPVSVVTCLEEGLPYGTTVSAFASLSLDPPMVLVSLDHRSDLLVVLRRTGRFGLNILSDRQAELAVGFARKGGPDKFASVAWEEDHGVPRIPDALGFVACDVTETVTGGDHLIVLGGMVSADTVPGAPLTYHARSFGTHVAHDDGP